MFSFKHKIFSISVVNRKSFENPLENGHVVFPYKCSFKTTEKNNLTVFAVCYLDTKQFSSQNNLELSTRNVSLYHGAVTAERVLVDGQPPLESNMFADSGGNQHIGPVYGNNGTFFAGSNVSPTTQNQLNLVSTKNTKIRDYRIPFKQKRLNKVGQRRKPIFSELYSSVDSSGTVRASFDLNMESIYMHTSGYAKLLFALDKDIYNTALDHIVISDLSVYSQRIKEKTLTSQAGTRKVISVPVGYRKKVIGSKESLRGLDTVNKDTAKIQELDIHIGKNQPIKQSNRKRRTVCFSHSNPRFTRGKIGYSLELSYKDPSEQIILDLVRDASVGLSALKNYKRRARRLTNYNYHAKQTKPNLYNGTGAGIWRNAVEQFVEMYTLMYDTADVDFERLTANLVLMVHPKTLTMRSLNWFCEKYSYMFNRLKKYFKSIIPSFTPDVKLGYVNSDIQKGKLLIKHNFEQTVDISDYRTSVSFVPKALTGDAPDEGSFPTLSYGTYRAMVRSERLRFFNDNPAFTSKMVPFLNQDLLDQLNNIDYSSYTYFSPSSITHGIKNRVDIDTLEKVDLNAFNHIYNLATRKKHRVGYLPLSRRHDNINSGRKSSFYIKESRRESESIEEYKSAEDNLGSESTFINSQEGETKIDTPNLNEKTKNRFKSYDRAKAANFLISFEEFNMRNQKNILTEVFSKNIPDSKKKIAIRNIPLHLKALIGSEYGFTKNNIFYGHEDLLQDTQVRDLIKTCFLSLVKIQYLEDYVDGNLKNAKWRDMTNYSFNSLIVKRNKTVLCKIVPYNNAILKLESDLFDKLGIENKYFFISKEPDLEKLKIKGRRVRTGGRIIVERQGAEKKTNKRMNSFVNNSILDTMMTDLGCSSLVVSQPASKNGPLRQVDYKESNDLVGTRTARPTRSMANTTTTNTGGSY